MSEHHAQRRVGHPLTRYAVWLWKSTPKNMERYYTFEVWYTSDVQVEKLFPSWDRAASKTSLETPPPLHPKSVLYAFHVNLLSVVPNHAFAGKSHLETARPILVRMSPLSVACSIHREEGACCSFLPAPTLEEMLLRFRAPTFCYFLPYTREQKLDYPPPPGAPEGGHWERELSCGKNSWLIGVFLCCVGGFCVAFCPIDKRRVSTQA